MASAPSAEEPITTALTEYEKRRLENVKRNQAMITSLRIENARAEIELNGKLCVKGGYKRSVDNHGQDSGESVVTRRLRSSRVAWTSEELQKVEDPWTPDSDKWFLTTEQSRKPLPLSSVHVQGSSTESFISCLRDLDDETPLSVSQYSTKASDRGVDPSQYSLQKDDIYKVVPERIVSVAFLPVRDRLFVVAGDIDGHVGFWDVECQDPESDGLHVYQPHAEAVSGLCIGAFSASKIFTCSRDGTIKQLDAETSMFDLKYSSENALLSTICAVPGSPTCVYTGDRPGFLRMLDTREKAPAAAVQIHDRRINTIAVNPQEPWQMVTSSSDTKVRIWDVRKLKNQWSKIGGFAHQKAVNSAAYSPSGQYIATCSYDDTVAIMRTTFKAQPRFIAHRNMTNRWISPFRAIWGWDDEYIYVGSMKRTLDIISRKFEIQCHWLSSPLMMLIPCRLAAHPFQPGVLAGCAAGGQVFVWRQ